MNNTQPEICKRSGLVEFQFDPKTFKVTDEMRQAYDWDGAFIVRGLMDKEDMAIINKFLKMNTEIYEKAYEMDDGHGRFSRLLLWNHPGSDVTGMVARCEKVAGTCEQLLGGEVYHYHTKLMMKMPKTGGQHLWHQDYGYWYKNGCLRPDMMTAYIAVDKCVKENGCLQVVKGTNRCGRIDHTMAFGQTTAEPERVEHLCKHFEHLHVEMEPGDCLFFHCNVLHTAGPNESDLRRWTFLCSYNRADNDPIKKHHHPNYTPLEKVGNDAIKTCTNFTDLSGKDFMDPKSDKTINVDSGKDKVKPDFH